MCRCAYILDVCFSVMFVGCATRIGEASSSQGLLGGDAKVREKLQEVSKTD